MARRDRQLTFRFLQRIRSRERRFRAAIASLTLLAILAILVIVPSGREFAVRAATGSRRAWRSLVGSTPDRAEIEAEAMRKRLRDVAGTRGVFRDIYAETRPAMRRLLEYSGLSPDVAVIRWGNFDKVLLLPGTVFEDDDSGRSYRMRPDTRSVWLRNVALPRDLAGFFLVPDKPELRDLVVGTGAAIVAGSEQATNSWGCRGPEPDLSAPVRGIVLGDSTMQGLFVADTQTPPARLAIELEKSLGQRVSILNTGHLGYSPEQYARTLDEYGDRFKPSFVVLTLCVNDFGDVGDAVRGVGDWDETRYWIDHIRQWCRTRDVLLVLSPVPYDHQVTASRLAGGYPGKPADLIGSSSLHYVFPIEDLVDEFLRARSEARRSGRPSPSNPLYNTHIDDHHFSPLGCEVWGKALARRLALLLEWRQGEKANVKVK